MNILRMYPSSNSIENSKSVLYSWVNSNADLYSDKNIFYIILNAVDNKNNFAVNNGMEFFEKVDGRILKKAWNFLGKIHDDCILKDCYVGCDEFHAIILVDRIENADMLVGTIIREFKALSTNLINTHRITFGKPLWQNAFQLDIINNYKELFDIITEIWE